MSIINVEVDKALKDVRDLITELNNLKGAINGIQGVSSKAFMDLSARVVDLETKLKSTNIAMKELKTTTEKQAESAKKSKNAYTELVNAVSKAEKEALKLTAEFGKNSKAAQDATTKFQLLSAELKNIQGNVRKTSSSIILSKSAYDKLSKSVQEAKNKAQSLIVTKGKENAETKKATALYKQLKGDLDKATLSTKKATTATKKKTAATKKNTTANNNAFKGIVQLAGALGFTGLAVAIGRVIKQTFTLTVKFQSLGFAIKQTSKDLWEAGRSTQFLLELNKKFGADLVTTTERWLKFRKAAEQSGLTLLSTKRIFESVTKASAVMGLRTDELKGVYLALEQMLSKGKVTTEELRRQLGERLPGAMGIMAASMGKTIPELDKMMKKGEVLSAEVLPDFAEALEVAYGIDSLDKVENLATSIGKMQGAWQSFVLYVINSESKFSNVLQAIMSEITETINAWTKILGSEETVFNLDLIIREGSFKKNLKETANLLTGAKDRIIEIDEEILQHKLDLVGKEESIQKELNKKIDELTQEKIELNKKSNEKMKSIAASQFEDARIKYEKDKKEYETALKDKADLTEKSKNQLFTSFTDVNEKIESTKNTLLGSAAAYNIYRELIEAGDTDGGIDKDEQTSAKKRIRYAKEYSGSLKDQILNLKELAKTSQRVFTNERQSYSDRKAALEVYSEAKKKANELELAEDLKKINDKEIAEQKSWKSSLSRYEDLTTGKGLEQYEEYKKQMVIIDQKYEDQRKEVNIEYGNEVQANEQELFDNRLKLARSYYSEMSRIEDESHNAEMNAIDEEMKLMDKSTKNYATALEKKEKLALEHANKMIDIRADALIAEAAYYYSIGEIDVYNSIWDSIEGLYDLKKGWVGAKLGAEDYMNITADFLNEIDSLGSAIFDAKIARIDAEIEKETEKYDKLLELAKGDEAEQKIIERNKALRLEKLEKEKKKKQIKQAKFEKALAINQAIISTALAVLNAANTTPFLPLGLAMTVVASTLGSLQIATIAAQPIPTFAKGGVMDHDGVALINDGGNKEYVERNGQILSTSNENALVNLQKGDVIHKDYDTMIRKSMIMNGTIGGSMVSGENYDGIEMAIDRGFKKAKINNNISVLNESNSYENEMTTWN